MKIIFFFNGTGTKVKGLMEPNSFNIQTKEKIPYKNKVIRVYIRGCEHEKVGDGIYFPNFAIITQYIRSFFKIDKTFDLQKLYNETFEQDWIEFKFNKTDKFNDLKKEIVDEIVIEGFSRGGVTAFALALELDSLGIPMHIIANQAVPGELVPELGLYDKYHDLTQCKNIRSATQLLAAHPKNHGSIKYTYLKQMVAQFSQSTAVSSFFIPQQIHDRDSLIVCYHIGNILLSLGFVDKEFTKEEKVYSGKRAANYEEKINAWYDGYSFIYNDNHGWVKGKHRYCFTPKELTQEIYGVKSSIPQDPYYVKWVQNKATIFIKEHGMENFSDINKEQAASIFSLSKEGYSSEFNQQLLAFLLTDNAKDFRHVINKTEEVCEYLTNTCHSELKDKYKNQAMYYKKAVFQLSYQYFNSEKKLTDKKTFKEALYQEEIKFRRNALHSHNDTLQLCLKFLTNFITHCSGIGLIFNMIHKYQTGNWLLFNHNEHVEMVRNNRMNLSDKFNI